MTLGINGLRECCFTLKDRDRRPELYNDTDYEHEDDKRGILAGVSLDFGFV